MFGLEFLLMASTAVGVGSNLYQGFAGSRAGKMQAQIARQNTELFTKQAGLQDHVEDLAFARSNFEETRVRDAVKRVVGAQSAHFSASNIDTTTGSPLLLAAMTVQQGETDAALIEAQGLLDAAEIRSRKASLLQQAAGSSFDEAAALDRAFSARVAGYFGAGTAMLSAARQWPGLTAGDKPSAGLPLSINRYAAGPASAYPWKAA